MTHPEIENEVHATISNMLREFDEDTDKFFAIICLMTYGYYLLRSKTSEEYMRESFDGWEEELGGLVEEIKQRTEHSAITSH